MQDHENWEKIQLKKDSRLEGLHGYWDPLQTIKIPYYLGTLPILLQWAELYPILIKRAEYTGISLSAANQFRVLRHPSSLPIRIEY